MATESLLAYGDIIFEAKSNPFDSTATVSNYRWDTAPILGQKTSSQFTGIGIKSTAIRGRLFPYFHGKTVFDFLKTLEEYAERGEVRNLVDFSGKNLGRYFISQIIVESKSIDKFGIPQEIGFSAALVRYDR